MSIDDIMFVDAVLRIPQNAVKINFTVETYERGEMITVEGVFGPTDIRDAINLFDQTVAGEYPLYVVTENGLKFLKQMKEEAERKGLIF